MPINKEKQLEKQRILNSTLLTWKRKNIFALADSPTFEEDFQKIRHQLERFNYTLFNYFFEDKGIFSFHFHSALWQIYIESKFKDQSKISQIFKFLDENFERNGYTGTNEWKRDYCRIHKIPMVKDLQFLDPDEDKYWYNDELCQK